MHPRNPQTLRLSQRVTYTLSSCQFFHSSDRAQRYMDLKKFHRLYIRL